MCRDCRAFSKQTIRSQLSLLELDEVRDHVGRAKLFSTIDLRFRYHPIRTKTTDVFKTAVQTRYGQPKYLVTSFGLAGAPECLQTLMNDISRPYLDRFVDVYLCHISEYSKTKREHSEHVDVVLKSKCLQTVR